jgi:hypothetical protein
MASEDGIRWYLLVQSAPAELRLFRLDGGHCAEHAVAVESKILHLTEPCVVDIDPTGLLRRSHDQR